MLVRDQRGQMMRFLLFAMAMLLAMPTWSSALLAQGPKAPRPVPCDLFDGGALPDPKSVVATCTQLIESGKLTGRRLARAHLTRILARMVSGTATIDHSQMIAEATAVIENDPQERLGYLFRLDSYLQTGGYDRALQDANKYVELDPSDSSALNKRSAVYTAKGDFERALADNTKAVEIAPKSAEAWGNRASTYLKAGRTADALSDLNRALSLPGPSPRHHYQRGKVLEAMGRTEEAIVDYRNAIKRQGAFVDRRRLRLDDAYRLEAGRELAEYEEALKRLGAAP
jgi:tetratricopeptide (TPR) repeat protein